LINLHLAMLLEVLPFGHLGLDPPGRHHRDPDLASQLGLQRLEEVYEGSIGSLNEHK
jgi:hypothetical protein